MLDFICNGSVDLFGTGRELQILRDSNPQNANPRQEKQCLRPLGHEGLLVIRGVMSYMIIAYKFKKKNCYVTIRVKLIMIACVSELNVKLNFHFLSRC